MQRLSCSSPRARLALIALGWAAAASVPACAISFGGYELDPGDGGTTTTAGRGSTGGTSSSATTAGGGGRGGHAGAGQGGTSGSGGGGGIGQGGSGGSATGGAGGSVGGNAGSRDGGATGGVAGMGGVAGSAGRAGSSGAGGAPPDGGPGGSAGRGGSIDAGTDGGPLGCPLLPGPQLIELPLPAGAPGAPGTYCVDQTEVTNKQYADFLATNPSTTQPGACSWNMDFTPGTMANPENCPNVSLVYDPIARPNYPVACIDWCDATAYCKSVGKHLCRSFAGTDLPTNKTTDATSDEWYAACSAAGSVKFSYGNTYQGNYCNMDLFGAPSSIQVGTAPACHGPSLPYSYLYDMNGNVAEWQAACNGAAGAADTCSARGGSWLSSNSPDPTRAGDCVAAPTSARNRRSSQIGFRCCYDRK